MYKRTRKISFFRISLEEHKLIDKRNTTQINELSNSETEKLFKEVYNKMTTLKNDHRACNVRTPNNDYVIEAYEYSNHILVARIGQQNTADTVALRDYETLESEDVPMSANQLLELYTFFMIDFETGILSYIGLNGAPKLSAIKQLFDESLFDRSIVAKLSVIMTDDVLDLLTRKDTISKITLSVAIPDDEILSEVVGLSKKDFDFLGNIKTKTATFKLVASKNKNLLKSSNELGAFIGRIKERFGDSVQHINVNAKNIDEKTQTYDLMNYNFTKKVEISGNKSGFSQDELIEVLKTTYNTNKRDLIRYSKC